MVPGPRGLNKSVDWFVKLKYNSLISNILVFVWKHSQELKKYFLLYFCFNKGVREINLSSGLFLLDGNVRDHVNTIPGCYRGIAFEVVNSFDLLVTLCTESCLMLSHSSIKISFELEGPGGRKEVCSFWQRKTFVQLSRCWALRVLQFPFP